MEGKASPQSSACTYEFASSVVLKRNMHRDLKRIVATNPTDCGRKGHRLRTICYFEKKNTQKDKAKETRVYSWMFDSLT
jgi:hypothetical protein